MLRIQLAMRCILLAVALLVVANASTAAIDIQRIDREVILFDGSQGFTGEYVAYAVTNNDPVHYADLWVTLTILANPVVRVAPFEDGAYEIGSLAPGETKPAYLYVEVLAQELAEEYLEVGVHEGSPGTPPLTTRQFLYPIVETLIGLPEKVWSISHTPADPAVGDTVRLTVTGETGRVGLPQELILSPASLPNWPADVFELIGVSAIVSSVADDCTAVVQTGEQDLVMPLPDSGPFCYVAEYTFRITAPTVGPTTVSPIHFVSSGAQLKHPDLDCLVLDCELPEIPAGTGTGAPPAELVVPILGQNHPNPFNPRTVIPFRLKERAYASLTIHDITGRRVRTLLRETLAAGPHEVVWRGLDQNGRQVASGLYLYRLAVGPYVETQRMALLK